jgi:hypothetical protein
MVEKQFAELGMDKARFTIDVTTGADATSSGFDAIEFIVQTNPGLSPQPLRRIASGGELSRIMLALKGVLAAGDRVSVLVFDEIDANVGGRLGSVIGSKLRQLATHHQVLCITHLPQIACYGDRHLTVRKEVTGKQTRTSVRVVGGEERLQEIAEMIGGQRITDTTRAQARELLDAAQADAVPPEARPQPTPGQANRGREAVILPSPAGSTFTGAVAHALPSCKPGQRQAGLECCGTAAPSRLPGSQRSAMTTDTSDTSSDSIRPAPSRRSPSFIPTILLTVVAVAAGAAAMWFVTIYKPQAQTEEQTRQRLMHMTGMDRPGDQ